jgi:hypothetical protein
MAAPLALVAWQLYEGATSGAIPAAVLTGYMQTHGLQALARKARSAAALVVHLGWVVSPLVVVAGFVRGARWRWIIAALAAGGAAFYNPNPLFWASFGCGMLVLSYCVGRDFLGAWVLVFFAGALVVFFAGSARYLLPIAAPVAILAARACGPRILALAFALEMTLSLGLAVVNYQHWDAYREFAASLSRQIDERRRTWINAEWGLRYYLESEGALPLTKEQILQGDEMLVSSALALPVPVNMLRAPVAEMEIRPSIPLRIISLDGRSAYSTASARGLLPFEISSGPIDRVRAEIVVERKPELTDLDPLDPKAAGQIVSGLYPDGWMTRQATVMLKRPDRPKPLRLAIYIPPQAAARRVQMLVDGQLVAQETFPRPGAYTLATPPAPGPASVMVTLVVDQTFLAPPDQRDLGIIIKRIGFQ